MLNNIYDENQVNAWVYLIRTQVRKLFGKNSEEFNLINSELDSIPKLQDNELGPYNTNMMQSLENARLGPEREKRIKAVYHLLKEMTSTFTPNQEVDGRKAQRFLEFTDYLVQNGYLYNETEDIFYLKHDGKVRVYPNNRTNLLQVRQLDSFYKDLASEINISWKLGMFTSTLVLSRKFIENLVIDLLRKKYPNPAISADLALYYNIDKNRFNDLSVLLENLKNKKNDFGIDEPVIEEFLLKASTFKNRANRTAHSLIVSPSERDLFNMNVTKMVELLESVLSRL